MDRFKTIDGWMNDEELSWLYTISKEMKSVVEIGSWKGRSTFALLCGCDGIVTAVDHFQGSKFERDNAHKEAVEGDIYKEFLKNVGMFNNLRVMKMDSVEASKKFKGKADMVFIDGGHTYEEVKDDIEAWLPRTRKIICGHDYGWESINRAVTEKFGNNFKILNSIWIYDLRNNKNISRV